MNKKQKLFNGMAAVVTNTTLKSAWALILIITLSVMALSCDDGKDDDPPVIELPHEQTPVTINLALGLSYTATVKGTLTDTQWNGVATKIQTAINNAYTNVPAGLPGIQQQGAIENAFSNNNVVINAENTTEYSIYKVVADNKTTLWVNINGLNNLQAKIVAAATAMVDGTASKE